MPPEMAEWLTKIGKLLDIKTPSASDTPESHPSPQAPLPPGSSWMPVSQAPQQLASIVDTPTFNPMAQKTGPDLSGGSVSPEGLEKLQAKALQPPSSGPPPLLRKGDADNDGWVAYLQALLSKHLGSGTPPVNGQFDQATFDAVVKFQQLRSLSVDGVVGDQSWQALKATGQPPRPGGGGDTRGTTGTSGGDTGDTTGTGGTDETDETTTPQGTPSDLPPPVDGNLHPTRVRIIQFAESMVGKVSDVGGEGGMKKGWQHLKEFYDVSLGVDSAKNGWLKGIQTPGQRAGSSAQDPSGISWCGIFAIWATIKAGVPGVKWVLGTAIKGLPAPKADQHYQPGDILVIKGKEVHHCVLKAKNGNSLTTIDGNVINQGIEVRNRNAGQIWYYYQTVAD